MASSAVTASSICMRPASPSFKGSQFFSFLPSGLSSISLPVNRKAYPSLTTSCRNLQICCAAKPETVDKVCKIVKQQLALPNDSSVTGESKFATLGADSLDTVEIVMGLEEEFGISVEEESAQTITTVQDAADMIEKLIEKKGT